MTNSIKLFLVLILCLLSSPLFSQHFFHLNLNRNFGTTLYHFKFSDSSGQDQGLNLFGKSKLEYPLNTWDIDFGYSRKAKLQNNRSNEWQVQFNTNLSQPSGKMTDKDWIGNKSSNPDEYFFFMFSSTKSKAELRNLSGKISVYVGPYKYILDSLYIGFNLNLSYFDYTITGFSGWQLDDSGNRNYFDLLEGETVLTYNQLQINPQFSIKLPLKGTEQIEFNIYIGTGPALIFDKDNHVLRYKTLRTTAWGVGTDALFNLYIHFSPKVSLQLSTALKYLKAQGEMVQKYYGDDPLSDGFDDTGMRYPGFNNNIEQFSGSIITGLRFKF